MDPVEVTFKVSQWDPSTYARDDGWRNLGTTEKARRMTQAAAVIHVGGEREKGKILPVHVVF